MCTYILYNYESIHTGINCLSPSPSPSYPIKSNFPLDTSCKAYLVVHTSKFKLLFAWTRRITAKVTNSRLRRQLARYKEISLEEGRDLLHSDVSEKDPVFALQ